MTSIFDQNLPRNQANFTPISPLGFIERTAEVYPGLLVMEIGGLLASAAMPRETA